MLQSTLPEIRPVFVTGMGCASALGIEERAISAALRKGDSGIREISLFSTEGCHCHRAGEIAPDEEANIAPPPPRFPRQAHRISRLLWHCWDKARESRPGFLPKACVFGTTSGGMSYGEQFFQALREGERWRELRDEVREYLPQQAAQDLILGAGWDLVPTIISNACASGTNAIGHAWRLIAAGICDRVICGGYDALSHLVFAGFHSLRALSAGVCRPFDRDRDGLLLGEGAAVLLLESEDSVAKNRSTPIARVLGYGAATDNYHLTQPDPGGSGPLASMRASLRAARLDPSAIGYINAHGTATKFNDASEGAAIAALFPQVPTSSTKALTGHALGAAGAIEAVFCLLCLREGFFPAQANLQNPDPEIPIRLATAASPLQNPVIISNSFGFGGSNASILLSLP